VIEAVVRVLLSGQIKNAEIVEIWRRKDKRPRIRTVAKRVVAGFE
jgi:hypothetical protein